MVNMSLHLDRNSDISAESADDFHWVKIRIESAWITIHVPDPMAAEQLTRALKVVALTKAADYVFGNVAPTDATLERERREPSAEHTAFETREPSAMDRLVAHTGGTDA